MSSPGARPQASREAPPLDSRAVSRILIVDDEQSMREWMRILFQRDGFDSRTKTHVPKKTNTTKLTITNSRREQ